MQVVYIVENHYGNFVPHLASVFVDEQSNALLAPEASAMACINLGDAQRTVATSAPAGAMVFLIPIKLSPVVEFLQLAALHAANMGRVHVVPN